MPAGARLSGLLAAVGASVALHAAVLSVGHSWGVSPAGGPAHAERSPAPAAPVLWAQLAAPANGATLANPALPPTAATPSAPGSADGQKLYFSIDEVDKPAVPRVAWEWPARLGVPPADDSIIVRLWISARGTVDRLEFGSSGLSPLQQAGLSELLRGGRFEPARRSGRAVPSFRQLELKLGADPDSS